MKRILFGLVLIHTVAAAELDKHQQKGVQDTQNMLKSPHQRNEAIKNDATAKEVDAKVDALTGGGQTKEDVYGLASEIFEKVAAEAKGDPEKMQQLLMEAQSNPQKFYDKYFTEAQKAKVRGIANKTEKKGVSPSPKK